MPVLLALKLFFGGALKKLLGWLGSLNAWQIALIASLIFGGVQTIRVKSEQRHSAKLSAQVTKLSDQLVKLSTAKNEQKVITRTNIETVTKVIHDKEKEALKVEQAPVPSGCRTKQEVLSADL